MKQTSEAAFETAIEAVLLGEPRVFRRYRPCRA